MKKILVSAVMGGLVFVTFCGRKSGEPERFSFSPQKPQPGETVTVRYDPTGTDLDGSASISLVAYAFSAGRPEALDTPLAEEGGVWAGRLSVPEKASGLLVKFVDDDRTDAGGGHGYIIPV